MALENKILSITNPTIVLDEIAILDRESSKDTKFKSLLEKPSRKIGDMIPEVVINGYNFNADEFVSIIIDETGFIPTVQLSIVLSNGIFTSNSFPTDGDVVSVYIRSKIKTYKPIRCDFEITGVNSSLSTDNSGDIISYTINGMLRVPYLTSEHCKAFKSKNTFDTLLDVSNELKLGFASNETTTNDVMTYICGFDTYGDFIRDTTLSAYKDEESFFGSFIDK